LTDWCLMRVAFLCCFCSGSCLNCSILLLTFLDLLSSSPFLLFPNILVFLSRSSTF
jgi:hypothetical protein